MAVTVNAANYGLAVYGGAFYGKVIVSGIDQVEATGQVNTVTVHTAAGITGVEAIGNIKDVSVGGFEIDIVERIPTGVSAEVFVNTVQVNVSELLDSVVTTSAINGEGINIKSVNYIPVTGVQATGYVSAQANTEEPLLSVEATGYVNDVTVHTTAGIVGVSATGVVNDDIAISNKIVSSSVAATGAIGSVQTNFTKEIVGVSATTSLQQTNVHVSEKVSNAAITGHIGSVTVVAVKFDFKAVRGTYSRRRTVYIPRAA